MDLWPYAKFIVAVVGAGVTSALEFATQGSPAFMWLTVASSVLTAIGVYAVPNKPAATPPAA